mmetsp:Transcript_57302/g.134558  ORF Transcript_57302/g.134558 Transcript_57302/m.134558 type:complete len:300 (-) Transcript_57302:47-946(-)
MFGVVRRCKRTLAMAKSTGRARSRRCGENGLLGRLRHILRHKICAMSGAHTDAAAPRRIWEHHTQFRQQIAMCKRCHIKSQHECLLRQLQAAYANGLLASATFSENAEDSFLGWVSFKVAPSSQTSFHICCAPVSSETAVLSSSTLASYTLLCMSDGPRGDQVDPMRSQEFRMRIEKMFPGSPTKNTVNNVLRRAGLLPEHSWSGAWLGESTFNHSENHRTETPRASGASEAEDGAAATDFAGQLAAIAAGAASARSPPDNEVNQHRQTPSPTVFSADDQSPTADMLLALTGTPADGLQ